MGVMALFHRQKMFSFRYFFLKRLIFVLDSYFIHRYIIIEYGQVRFRVKSANYEGVSINNQPMPFLMDRDGHHFNTLFQYMFYTGVQNCTRIEIFFNKILNVKHA